MLSTDLPPDTAARDALTAQQTLQVRDLLVARWREQVRQIIEMSLQLHAEPEVFDPARPRADEATGRTVRRLAAAHRHLADLEDALQRLGSGAFGRCLGCGEPIPFSALLADPAAGVCPGCGTLS